MLLRSRQTQTAANNNYIRVAKTTHHKSSLIFQNKTKNKQKQCEWFNRTNNKMLSKKQGGGCPLNVIIPAEGLVRTLTSTSAMSTFITWDHMFFWGTDAPAVFVCLLYAVMCQCRRMFHWLLLPIGEEEVVVVVGTFKERGGESGGSQRGSPRGSGGQMCRIHQTHSPGVTGETHTLWMRDGWAADATSRSTVQPISPTTLRYLSEVTVYVCVRAVCKTVCVCVCWKLNW